MIALIRTTIETYESFGSSRSCSVHSFQGRPIVWLLAAWLIYIIARLPPVFHAAGAMDEQFFSIPGYTVATEGIPRIPFLPAKKRETFFEGADVCLFALPPALHYCQAPFYWFMPLTNAAARMPAFLSGFFAILLVWLLARQAGIPDWISGIGCILFAVSRPLMFTAMIARPDLPCIVCGWAVLWLLWRWQNSLKWSTLIAAGALCGLGLLFHPFAMVYCLQAGFWTLGRSGSIAQRILRASALTCTCIAVFALWLPLILSYPEQFRSQFFSNVLERSGPGILGRMLYPWPYFPYHWEKQWEFNEPTQFVLVTSGLLITTLLWCWKLRTPSRMGYLAILWTGAFLTMVTAGIHPTKGYWAYTIGLAYPAIVESIVWLIQQTWHLFHRIPRRESKKPTSQDFADHGGDGFVATDDSWFGYSNDPWLLVALGRKRVPRSEIHPRCFGQASERWPVYGRCQLCTRCLCQRPQDDSWDGKQWRLGRFITEDRLPSHRTRRNRRAMGCTIQHAGSSSRRNLRTTSSMLCRHLYPQ